MSTAYPGFRNRYRRSGKVAWARFLPWSAATLAVSLAMAVGLYLAFRWGWYFFGLTPLVAALPVAGVARLAVGGAHCRNRVVAGAFGLLAAAALYLGYFHVHLVAIAGPPAIHRLDALPRFIAFRMQTDVVVDEAGNEEAAGSGMNWIYFGIDFLVVIGLVVAVTTTRAGQVYCESCQRWGRQLTTNLPKRTAIAVQQALESGGLADLAEVPLPTEVLAPPCANFTVEYCRNPEGQGSCPVYMTAKELSQDKGAKVILNQVEVSAEELRELAEKIPALGLAEAGVRPSAVAHPASPFVEALPLEAGDAVLNNKVAAMALAWSLMPLFFAVAGIAMVGVGLWRQPWVPAPGASLWLTWLLVGTGGAAGGFGVAVCWNNLDFFNLRFSHRLTRQAIQWRPSAVVNPEDPEVVFVEIVPRARWGEIRWEPPSDAGFVKVDTAARQLLFEGLRERYRIPGDALASCEVELITATAGRFATYVTVISTRDPHAPDEADASDAGRSRWEAPMLPRPTRFGKYGPVQRRGLPEALRDRIRQIMPADGIHSVESGVLAAASRRP